MNRSTRTTLWTLALLCTVALVAGGCATTGATPDGVGATETYSCDGAGVITAQVSPEVELTGVGCFFKAYKGVDSLHFEIKLKNIDDAPHRYRVNLFLDNGKAVGGLVPRKGKPPVVKPGEEASFTYPVKGMGEKAGAVELYVTTLGQ